MLPSTARLGLLAGGLIILPACTASEPAEPADPARVPAGGLERIAYSSLRPGNWDIYHFTGADDSPRRLTDHAGLDYGAVPSPDGRWVVFTSERRGNPDLYALDLEGDGDPRLLIDSPAMEDQAAFDPDGNTLAFVSTRDGNADVYVMPFDPTRQQTMADAINLTQHPGGDFRPAFAPDGRHIAFSSDRDTPVVGHPFFPFTRQREGDIYLMTRDGTDLTRLTTTPNWDGSPAWSANGRTIYFYSARGRTIGPPQSPILGQEGGFRIWAMDRDGANARLLTPEGTEAFSPTVGPEGRIAFASRTAYDRWRLESVDPDGTGGRVESTADVNYWMPAYLPDGTIVAHGVGPTPADTPAVDAVLGPGGLLAADYPATVDLPDRTVSLYPLRHTTGLAPHPSRDETVVTIEDETGSRVAVSALDGSNPRELFTMPGVGIVTETGIRLFDLKWSPAGDWITFTEGVFAGGPTDRADIWVMRPDGSGRARLTSGEAVNNGVAAFSPDGTRLVFRSARNGAFDLYVMHSDGTEIRQVTDSTARENFPVFSPTGDAVAFSSDLDGPVDAAGHRTFDNYLLEIAADGTPGPLTRLTDDPGQDAHPWFSPDGAWIVYTSERAGISDEEPLVQEVLFGPQMYGELFAQRLSDGLTMRLTHNKWEEGNPFWLLPAQDATAPDPAR